MMKFLCSSLLLALVSPVVARMKSGVASEHELVMELYKEKLRSLQGDGPGRDLQDIVQDIDLLDGICTELLDATIGGVGAALLGETFACTCDIELLPPAIFASCGTGLPVCFVPPDIVCGKPLLEFGIDLFAILDGEFPLTGQVCYNDLVIFGALDLSQLPLCIGVDAGLFEIFGIGEDGVNVTIPEGALNDACTATVGDDECTSCEVCSGGLISFNCTEFHPELIATCADLGVIPTSFADLYRVDEVTLSLDGFE